MKLRATISLMPGAMPLTFAVTRSGGKRNDAYKLWVAVKSYEAGELIGASYKPVEWPLGGTHPVDGRSGPFEQKGTSRVAYVWVWPSSESGIAEWRS